MNSPGELLDRVIDRGSFITFVEALAAERRAAERLESAEPVAYQLGGALGWYNGDIPSFLDSCLGYFDTQPDAQPSWRIMAEFLDCGKIIE